MPAAALACLPALPARALAHPGRVFALIAQGDEAPDWREMPGRHPGSRRKIAEGKGRAPSAFERPHFGAAPAFPSPA
jgi:hypothetical protein